MAISASSVFEVRTTGSDTACSGGFVTGASGTDWSQQNAAQYSLSGLTSAGAGNIILTASASADMVGNLIQVTAGTNFNVGVFEITAVSVGVSITCSTNNASASVSTGVGASGTAVIGGAFASPAIAARYKTASNAVYIKAGTYAMTSSSLNVAGGVITENSAGANLWEGYNSTRGDLGTAPILQASGALATATLMTLGSSTGNMIRNIVFDGNSKTAILGFTSASRRCALYQVTVKNCTNGGILATGNGDCINCTVTNITGGTQAVSCGFAYGCEVYSNTVVGLLVSEAAAHCLVYSNSGASSDGIQAGTEAVVTNCVMYTNGRDGFRSTGGESGAIINCIAEGNSGWGFNSSTVNLTYMLINNAGFNNTSGGVNTTNFTGKNLNFVAGVSSFFVNAASSNFALNNTASAGAAARAAGAPGVFPLALTTGYLDIGAAQHQDPAAGGTTIYPIFD